MGRIELRADLEQISFVDRTGRGKKIYHRRLLPERFNIGPKLKIFTIQVGRSTTYENMHFERSGSEDMQTKGRKGNSQ